LKAGIAASRVVETAVLKYNKFYEDFNEVYVDLGQSTHGNSPIVT
jgi:hypothetical protein